MVMYASVAMVMVVKLRTYFIFFCLVKKQKQCSKTLEVNCDITHHPKLVAQPFGDHFSTIASNIVKDNPNLIYRHPNSKVNNFLQELNTKLSLITQKNKKCIIMGDININLIEKSRHTVDYLLMLQSSSFFSVLNKPTRITTTSKTLIDHILANDVNLTVKPCIIIHKIADHLPIACVISDEQFKNVGLQVKKIMYKRDIKNLNVETFFKDLHNSFTQIIPSLQYIKNENYNEKFDELINVIQKVINHHAPLVKLSRKQLQLYN